MKLSILFLASTFAVAGIASAQDCAYMKKTITLNTKSDKTQQVTQVQSPVLPAEQKKLLVDTKNPLSNAN